ncbi:MAG: hypothetical protein Q8Q12_01735 [bacterium]|nr:hypothetical protein [bacterium]
MSKDKNETRTAGEIEGPLDSARRTRKYVRPKIISCSAEELLSRVGSARACSGHGELLEEWERREGGSP